MLFRPDSNLKKNLRNCGRVDMSSALQKQLQRFLHQETLFVFAEQMLGRGESPLRNVYEVLTYYLLTFEQHCV